MTPTRRATGRLRPETRRSAQLSLDASTRTSHLARTTRREVSTGSHLRLLTTDESPRPDPTALEDVARYTSGLGTYLAGLVAHPAEDFDRQTLIEWADQIALRVRQAVA